MNAKEFFEDCQRKVRKFERTQERYAEMMQCDIGAIKYDEAHGGSSDPMARIDAAMDYLQIVTARSNELIEVLDYATSILYGMDSRSGLAKLKGTIYADSICMHYLQNMSWVAMAKQAEIYSDKQLRNYAMSGLSAIDRYGFAYLREGRSDEITR